MRPKHGGGEGKCLSTCRLRPKIRVRCALETSVGGGEQTQLGQVLVQRLLRSAVRQKVKCTSKRENERATYEDDIKQAPCDEKSALFA